MWHWHGSGWGWVWMTVVMVGIVMLVRSGAERGPRPRDGSSTPEDVLAKRFARGEIDVDEYERNREVLDGRRRT